MANGLLGLGGGGGGGGPAGEEGRKLPDEAPRKWVDLEATDEEGNTALGLCVALGHAEAVRVLVENGVRVNQGDRGALSSSLFPLLSVTARQTDYNHVVIAQSAGPRSTGPFRTTTSPSPPTS